MARGSIYTRVKKDGSRAYDAVIRLNGKQQWKTFAKKGRAEEWLDRHSTEGREGTYREVKPATFTEYTQHWRKTHLVVRNYKPSTRTSYLSILGAYLEPEFGPMQITRLSAAEINVLKARLFGKGLSAKTVRNVLNLSNKICKNAIADGYLKHSPMEGVERPAIPKKQQGRALKPTEIQALLTAADSFRSKVAFELAVLTALRRGEQFGLPLSGFTSTGTTMSSALSKLCTFSTGSTSKERLPTSWSSRNTDPAGKSIFRQLSNSTC